MPIDRPTSAQRHRATAALATLGLTGPLAARLGNAAVSPRDLALSAALVKQPARLGGGLAPHAGRTVGTPFGALTVITGELWVSELLPALTHPRLRPLWRYPASRTIDDQAALVPGRVLSTAHPPVRFATTGGPKELAAHAHWQRQQLLRVAGGLRGTIGEGGILQSLLVAPWLIEFAAGDPLPALCVHHGALRLTCAQQHAGVAPGAALASDLRARLGEVGRLRAEINAGRLPTAICAVPVELAVALAPPTTGRADFAAAIGYYAHGAHEQSLQRRRDFDQPNRRCPKSRD